MAWILFILAILGNLYLFSGNDIDSELEILLVAIGLIGDALLIAGIVGAIKDSQNKKATGTTVNTEPPKAISNTNSTVQTKTETHRPYTPPSSNNTNNTAAVLSARKCKDYFESVCQLLDEIEREVTMPEGVDCSLRRIFHIEYHAYLLHIAVADGRISMPERDFMNELFGMKCTCKEYMEFVQNNGLRNYDFVHRVPVVFQVMHEFEAKVQTTAAQTGEEAESYLELIFTFYRDVAEKLMICDGDKSDKEEYACHAYIQNILDYLTQRVQSEIAALQNGEVYTGVSDYDDFEDEDAFDDDYDLGEDDDLDDTNDEDDYLSDDTTKDDEETDDSIDDFFLYSAMSDMFSSSHESRTSSVERSSSYEEFEESDSFFDSHGNEHIIDDDRYCEDCDDYHDDE